MENEERVKRTIALANDKMIEFILCMSRFDGFDLSVEDIQGILDESCEILDPKPFQYVNALRKAWGFMLENAEAELDLWRFTCDVNKIVTWSADTGKEPGVLRTKQCDKLPGYEFIPPVVDEEMLGRCLDIIQSGNDPKASAIAIFTWIQKVRPFNISNARTAFVVANKILVGAGVGILIVTAEEYDTFMKEFKAFYDGERGDWQFFGHYIESNCIFGIEE